MTTEEYNTIREGLFKAFDNASAIRSEGILAKAKTAEAIIALVEYGEQRHFEKTEFVPV